jgi:predicted N-formylglutamate amidohydrolase
VGDDESASVSAPFHILGDPSADVLIVADHASNHVPPGIDLGIDAALLNDHVALDIGVSELATLLVEGYGMAAILGGVSRLVIDYNREPDAVGLVPHLSDGKAIPGNHDADVAHRIKQFYEPYHGQVAALTAQAHQPFILSLHSFTPQLAARPNEQRPWEIGILYNEDERTAPEAIRHLTALGYVVGDQLPYSGKLLNATMNRHAEVHRRPYLGIEVRQDIATDPVRRPKLASHLASVVKMLRAAF